MKKILFIAAASLLAVVSCNKELETNTPNAVNNAPAEFIASVDGAGATKTVMGEIDKDAATAKLYWNGAEEIRVFGANGSSKFYNTTVEKAETATFAAAEGSLEGADYIAVYPAASTEYITWTGNVADPLKKLWLAEVQHPVVDSYNPSAHVAVASTSSEINTLAFKNVVSFIKFTVGNEKVSNPTFYGNNDEVVSGNFDVVYSEGVPTVDLTAKEGYAQIKKASLYSSVEKDKTYYIAILPGTFEKGFTLEVEIEGNKYTKSTDKNVTIPRNKILDLGTITVEPQTVTYRNVYFKPNDAWKENGAWYAAWAYATGSEGKWYSLEDSDNDGVYEASIPENIPNVIFASMNSSVTEPDWKAKVYQTGDLTYVEGKNSYALDYAGNTGTWMTLEAAKDYVPVEPEIKTYLYLKPNSNWTQSEARFAAYFYGNGEYWVSMTDENGDGTYEVEVPAGYPNVIFCRMNPGTTDNSWYNKWNQTADLTVPTDGTNLYTVADGTWDKGGGIWSTYSAN